MGKYVLKLSYSVVVNIYFELFIDICSGDII